MHRKEDNQGPNTQPKTPNFNNLNQEKQLQLTISSFLGFYQTLPKSAQYQILPTLQVFSKKSQLSNHKRLQQIVSCSYHMGVPAGQPHYTSRNVINMCSQLLPIKGIMKNLVEVDQRLQDKRLSKKKQDKQTVFNSINVIHPRHDIYYKMSRQFDEQGPGFNLQKPEQSQYFAPPRLFVRLEEMKHFKGGNQLRGNILFLGVEGNSITGRNGFAITDKNNVQWWQKPEKNFLQGVFDDEKNQEKEIGSQTDLKPEKEKQKENDQQFKKLEFKFKIKGHHGKITSVSVSNDELYMLTAGSDCIVKLWCLRSQMQLTEYNSHLKTIWSVQFCQSGYFFLTASADGLAKMWKTDQPGAIRIFSGHVQDVYKAKFMPNPNFAVTSSGDGTVRIWNIQKASTIQVFHFTAPIYNICVSFSGRYLSVCEETGLITVFDLIKGIKLNNFGISTNDMKKYESQQEVEKQKQSKKPYVLPNINHINSKPSSQQPQFKQKSLLIHDMTFSQNDRQFACISSKHIILYSMDTICQKIAGNIYSVYGNKQQDTKKKINQLNPTQVIHIGRDSSLFYCKYHPKNYLVVGGTCKKY